MAASLVGLEQLNNWKSKPSRMSSSPLRSSPGRRSSRWQPWDTIADMRDRYIRASELRSLLYCERAWRFEYDDSPSTLESERAEGRREHAEHSSNAVRTRTLSYVGAVILGFGILGLAISVTFWILRSWRH
jgi:hypothetical protein